MSQRSVASRNTLHLQNMPIYLMSDSKPGVKRKQKKIKPIPAFSDVPTFEAKQAIAKDGYLNSKYDACIINNPCQNGGICLKLKHELMIYCDCPASHYGNTCQFIADQKECDKNFCRNNSTCYSIEEPRIAPNPAFFQNASKMGFQRYKDLTIEVNYECWCRKGYTGSFCEFSEEMRKCSEDQCNHHGLVLPFQDSHGEIECKCHCEKFYSGDQCEIIHPCRDIKCMNGGSCDDSDAKCSCPKVVEILSSVKVKGEDCATIIIGQKEKLQHCIPCQGNFIRFIKCLEENNVATDQMKSMLFAKLDEGAIEKLKRTDCFHNGICERVVNPLPFQDEESSGKFYLLPHCKCPTGYEGNFCERERPKEELKCVHGQLVIMNGKQECRCYSGYVGETCEIDPCFDQENKPRCKGGTICIEIPGHGLNGGASYACVCKGNKFMDNPTQECVEYPIVEKNGDKNFDNNLYRSGCLNTDGISKCKNEGICYPCSLSKDLEMCDESERERGFRCICRFGWKQPSCELKMLACDSHRCQNNATCVEIANSLDYSCDCQPGYEGKLCQLPLDICLREGSKCQNGICIVDKTFGRGFRCDCHPGYFGFNCDDTQDNLAASFLQTNFMWLFPLLVSVAMLALLALSSGYFEWKRKKQENQKRMQIIQDPVNIPL
ncbi:EGF-like domain-containing protein [Ditylenchus destructor]|uniref:EGF-like domain-containing protein n=1 Tax=Ditylenchus destructor TaxID=166010 RepID=A0AAD4NM29_9BILA|nr:EGF-like domain-containing protein [Ditylenchus destructor]